MEVRLRIAKDIKVVKLRSGTMTKGTQKKYQKAFGFSENNIIFNSCLTNYMPNNQFKKGELYSFITGKASTAIARNLQKKFNAAGLKITIEQWSVLYHL